jgi:predicted enzyme related to lactoylglutathione lyase
MKPFEQLITFLPSNDLQRTTDFYQSVLELSLVRDQGDCKIFRVSPAGLIGFCSRSELPSPAKSIILTLITDEVDEWFEKLVKAGAQVEKPPTHNLKYTIYQAFVLDPNGYRIEIQRFDDPLPG